MIFDHQKHVLEVNAEEALKLIHALTNLLEVHHNKHRQVAVEVLPMAVHDGILSAGPYKGTKMYYADKLTLMLESYD